MSKFISYNKLSKKKKKELSAQKRSGWNGVCPITRIANSKKAYNRATEKTYQRRMQD